MKNCPSCGQPCADTEKFCGNCGFAFTEANAVAPQAVSAQYGFAQPSVTAPKVATKKEFLKLPENKKIRSEINGSAIVAYVCAGVTLLAGILTGGFPYVLIDVAILVGLGLGIMLAQNRACAVILFAYALLNMIVGIAQNGTPSGYLVVIAGVLAIIYTFKAEKLWKQYQQQL